MWSWPISTGRENCKCKRGVRGSLYFGFLCSLIMVPAVVLGKPIRKASTYSSTMTVLGEQEHKLPIVIVNCFEKLYRTGKKTISMKLFWLTRNFRDIPTKPISILRTLPNRSRLIELINIFDSEE